MRIGYSSPMQTQTPLPYRSYREYLREKYPQGRIQKISIDAGFTCPNRDGTKGSGGCTYCNNESFTPSIQYNQLSVREQIDEGIRRVQRKYKNIAGYYGYFQSYSNTYAPLKELKSLYEAALSHPQVKGLSIGTRPDCVDQEKIDYLAELAQEKDIIIEYGVESISDKTLQEINRCHDFQCLIDALNMTKNTGVKICAHIILGLPGENYDHWMRTADVLSHLPIDFLKIHQLHIVKQTKMAYDYLQGRITLMDEREYLNVLKDFVERLNPDIVIQRLFGTAPHEILVSKHWETPLPTLHQQFIREMQAENRYQGQYYQ